MREIIFGLSMMISELILKLPDLRDQHARTTNFYRTYAQKIRPEIESHFKRDCNDPVAFAPFGEIIFPYFGMGNKSSLDLFDLDELIIFSFYWVNRKRYKKVLDIGANIGLHSLILAKCGYDVLSFEPDPFHFKQFQYILETNRIQNVTPFQSAVSNRQGEAKFIRVLGNTTSSHLEGCKNPYGELEEIKVSLMDIRDVMKGIDLIKMDVEGHENEILLATKGSDWASTDAIVEIGSPDKAQAIYDHCKRESLHLFSQKMNWEKVDSIEQMPMNYKEGSLFISKKSEMPWNQ